MKCGFCPFGARNGAKTFLGFSGKGVLRMRDRFIWVKLIGFVVPIILLGIFTYVSDSIGNERKEPVEPMGFTPPQQTMEMKGAKYVGSETCEACHAKEVREFRLSTHSRISIPGENVKAQGCEMCHGPASLHVEASGGKGNIINPRKNPEACFACHLDKKAEFRLPFHHPVMEGKMSCTDCHSPHGEEVRPWSATTLRDVNEACFKCHKDQRGPFVFEHEALREGCTTCHKVHGSINDKMLIARDNNLCLRCHTQLNFPTIGRQSAHAGRLPLGTCFSAGCHVAVHGSNFDDHLRN